MDRRSWLWRRKSSEKTPGETESSGSVSSPSERFSDEQVISSYVKHSPEVTSKPALNEEQNEQTKSLTEKLSAALLTITANEELVKQHAKVAEEAVTGWEKAEREVSTLKSQLDATLKKNSALEERVSHLDGALKECVRQLRQVRDEQERKIEEVIAKRTNQWELKKSELETQIIEVSSQLEDAKSEMASLRPKMDKTEKENKSLRVEMGALCKKLEVRTIERDFSTEAAESASKQHLDSIRKLAKVEGECRRLKLVVLKSSEGNKINDVKVNEPVQASSSTQITAMDDFLEMEKLAAMPDNEDSTLRAELEMTIKQMADLEDKIEKLEEEKGKLEMVLSESQAHMNDQLKVSEEELKATKTELMQVQDQLTKLQTQLIESEDQIIASRTEIKELKNQLIERENMVNSSQVQLKEVENSLVELKMQLTEREIKIKASQGHTNDMEARLNDCLNKLKVSEEQLRDANDKLVDIQAQLELTDKIKHSVERELEASNVEREEAEMKVKSLELEKSSLVDDVENERALSAVIMAKCQSLEDELSKRALEVDPHLQPPISFKSEKMAEQEKGIAIAASKLADCQRTIASLGKQLKSLATIDNFLVESDNPLEFTKDSSVFFRTSEPGKSPCIDCQ